MTKKIILFYTIVLCVIHREQLLFNVGTTWNTGVHDVYRLQVLLTLKLTTQTPKKSTDQSFYYQLMYKKIALKGVLNFTLTLKSLN